MVCEDGSMFHAVLFRAPRHETFHIPGRRATWRSTARHLHRIDSVGIPVEWSACLASVAAVVSINSGLWDQDEGTVTRKCASRSALGEDQGCSRPVQHQFRSTSTQNHISAFWRLLEDHLGCDLPEDRRRPREIGCRHRLGTS